MDDQSITNMVSYAYMQLSAFMRCQTDARKGSLLAGFLTCYYIGQPAILL